MPGILPLGGTPKSGPPPGYGYILLNANGTAQTGASPSVQLNTSGSLAVQDSAGGPNYSAVLLALVDGGGTTADDIVILGTTSVSSPAAGNTYIDAPAGSSGVVVLAASGAATTIGGNFTMPSPGTATSGNTQVNSETITLGASVWNTSGAGSAKAQSGTIKLLAGASGNPEGPPSMTFTVSDTSASGISSAFEFAYNSSSLILIRTNGNLELTAGFINVYKNISTAGWGVPAIYGAGLGVSLGTTSTAVCSYSGATGMYLVKWVLSCKTSSTPNLTLTYSDPQAGAQTITLYNSAMVGGAVESGVFPIYAATGTAIAVAGTDSVAAGDIYASAVIAQVQ